MYWRKERYPGERKRDEEMILEEIYKKVYANAEEIRKEDHELSSQLTPLIEGADLKTMTQEELIDLVCKSCALGEKKGFLSGVHFLASLICEALC